MTQSDLVPADEPFQSLGARRRVRRAAKLIVAIGLAIAGCVLAYHSLWSFRDEWSSLTADRRQNRDEIAAEIDRHTLARRGAALSASIASVVTAPTAMVMARP